MSDPYPHLYAVILAGGTGTRLWPRSRRDRPKQLLDLVSARTMLQQTYDRIAPLILPDHVYIITNTSYLAEVCAQLPEIPCEQIIGEPEGRGTAPPIGYAATLLQKRDPQAIMISLPADHYIQNEAGFRDAICAAADAAQKNILVTFGVKPTYPETGYGYIEGGEDLEKERGFRVRQVKRFAEKPDEKTAGEFVANGNYYWNGGMFIWRVSIILQEFERYLPQHAKLLQEIADGQGTPEETATFERAWRAMPNETIDVGIMEKSSRVGVIPLDVGWSDVGNWASLLELLPGDRNQNVVIGDHIGVDTHSSLIYSSERLITTVGLENMIVVDTGDVVLVCHREDAQKVKHLVDELKRRKEEKYL
ncbi:MAG: mannose-1-phosphate guanylyltransferase [Anaerolineae bacterium]